MLCKSSVLAVTWAIRLNIVLKTCPYVWDEQKVCLSVSKSVKTTLLFYTSLAFSSIRFAFMLTRCAQINSKTLGSNYFVVIILLSQAALAVGLQWNTYFKQTEGCCVINWLLHLDKSLTGYFQLVVDLVQDPNNFAIISKSNINFKQK